MKDGIDQAELQTSTSYVRMGVRNRADNGKLVAALRAIDQADLRPAANIPCSPSAS